MKKALTSSKIIYITILIIGFMSIVANTHGIFFDEDIMPKWILSICLLGILLLVCSIKMIMDHYTYSLSLRDVILCGGMLCLALTMWDSESYIDILIKTLFFITLYLFFSALSYKVNVESALLNSIICASIYNIIMGNAQFKSTYTGTYDTTVGLSLTYSLTIFILYYQNVVSVNLWKRYINFIFIIFLILNIIFLKSRISILSLLVGFFVILDNRYKLFAGIMGLIILFFISFVKIDSTKGRIFIYSTTLSMFQSPSDFLFGIGSDGFRNNYMLYQAIALKSASNVEKKLADNIKNPLSDVLEFILNYGAVRFVVFFCIIFMISRNAVWSPLSKSLMSTILIYSFFSYPFNYPITWIVSAWLLQRIYIKKFNGNISILVVPFSVILTGILLFSYSFRKAMWHKEWAYVFRMAYFGKKEEYLYRYDCLSHNYFAESYFYYNYASMLFTFNRHEEALVVLNKCKINNYETKLLYGNIEMQLQNYRNALEYYIEASNMCPNRFIPLFEMFRVYEKFSNNYNKYKLGLKILNKPIKIPSRTINEIKDYVKFSIKRNE